MEKKMIKVYKLSDNGDLSEYYVSNIEEVINHFSLELKENNDEVATEYQFTIEVIEMDEEEFNNLPEYEF